MQNSSGKYLLIGIVIALCILGAGIYLTRTHSSSNPSSTATSTTTLPGGIQVTGPATITETDMPVPNVPAPDHTSALKFDASISADIQQALNTEYARVKTMLATDPTNYNAWIGLGIIKKQAGDYQGAATDWIYVSKIYPKDTVALDDLGDLYMNFIKDYPKAEVVLKQAIAVNPHDLQAYENLFALYTSYGYKGTSAGIAIMQQAIQNNPNAIDLRTLFARYYKAAGDTQNAKVQYDAAIKLAQQQGNADMVAALQQEEQGL